MTTRQHDKPSLKNWLILSLLINGLAVAFVFRDSLTESHDTPDIKSVSTVPQIKVAPAQTPAQASRPMFHWSEVESEDYAMFISNLRNIGCPESTLRDIVEGELHASNAAKRSALERQILRSPSIRPPAGMSRQQFLEVRLRQFDQEFATMANSLLKHSAPGSVASAPAQSESQPIVPPVRTPLVFGNFALKPAASNSAPSAPNRPTYAGPGAIAATPEQVAAIGQLKEKFVKDIGGADQDPSDPEYAKRWNQSQPKADDLYRTWYGWEAFNDLSRATAQKAYNESLSGNAKTP